MIKNESWVVFVSFEGLWYKWFAMSRNRRWQTQVKSEQSYEGHRLLAGDR